MIYICCCCSHMNVEILIDTANLFNLLPNQGIQKKITFQLLLESIYLHFYSKRKLKQTHYNKYASPKSRVWFFLNNNFIWVNHLSCFILNKVKDLQHTHMGMGDRGGVGSNPVSSTSVPCSLPTELCRGDMDTLFFLSKWYTFFFFLVNKNKLW